jgi:hypothetical protein
MALAAASLWKQVLGVQATLLNEEKKVFLQNREQRILTQVFQAGWISDYADAYSFLNLFRSGHGRNDFGYSNSLYDALLDEVEAERIPSIRRRLMFETERLLLADVPFIPLYTYVTKRMVNPRLVGWESNVMDHHYSKHMFFLKAASDEPSAPSKTTEVIDTVTGAAGAVQKTVVPAAVEEAVLMDANPEPDLSGDNAKAAELLQEPGSDLPMEENEPGVQEEELPQDGEVEEVTTPEESLK